MGGGAAMSAELFAAARDVARHAHAPYSNFAVGAAVRLSDGQIVTGCNFENASYGMTLCAETVALASVNAMGRLRDVREIAVIGGRIGVDGALVDVGPVRPCGRCRQIIQEAADLSGVNLPVHCSSADGGVQETHHIDDLLPHAFGPKSLGLA